jgi:hypothetical protein
MQRELTKEELEAQISYKEQRLGDDLSATTAVVRERVGHHLKVTLPVALVALTGVVLLVRRLRVRRERAAKVELENDPRLAVVNLVRALGQLLPQRSLVIGALVFGVGALVGRRMRPRQMV